MNQDEFLKQLSLGLERLPATEREDILRDYRAYFNDALADGRIEADVAAALGDPQRLARELMAERKLKIWEANKTPANLRQVLGALAGLGAVNMLLAFPYLLVLTVLSSLWLSAVILLLSGLLMTGSWASSAVFGWPALNNVVLNDSGIGPWLITGQGGVSIPQINISTDQDEHVSIQTDANGKLVFEARDGKEQFRLEKDAEGNILRLEAKDNHGSFNLNGLPKASKTAVLVLGLILLLLGSLGSFFGWKILRALWRGTGSWLRWQWQLLNSERVLS
ncbi:MAG: DUF1700 domain-containing protein [Proteobacteria bacterium]|nr:DUF1700 domain-containing protein [Pseudomonadota bacterium]